MRNFPSATARIARPLRRVRDEHGAVVWSVYSTPIWVHEHRDPSHRVPYVKPENRQKLVDRRVTVHYVRTPIWPGGTKSTRRSTR